MKPPYESGSEGLLNREGCLEGLPKRPQPPLRAFAVFICLLHLLEQLLYFLCYRLHFLLYFLEMFVSKFCHSS